MKIAIVALSDIHFDATEKNPVLSRADMIAGAASSENIQLDGLVLVFAGDIANQGTMQDYEIAQNFIRAIAEAFKKRYPALEMKVVTVPGNHDCLLPKEEADHRKSQVEISLKTFNDEHPDRVFIDHLLKVQAAFWEFAGSLGQHVKDGYGKLFSDFTVAFGNHNLRLNLYNSAALSQRNEKIGQIYMPCRLLSREVAAPTEDDIVISVVHHPLQWLEPDNFLSFRRHLLRTSDLVLTGHQHRRGSYHQRHDTGESLRVYESPALYDRDEREVSSFRVISLDLSSALMKDCVFEWKDNLYRPNKAEIDWRPLELNRAIRQSFELSPEFQSLISDPGVVWSHPDRQRVALSDLFVYPDLRPAGGASAKRLIRGNEVVASLETEGIYLIQGEAFSGKTALAKSLFRDVYMEDRQIPIFLDGTGVVIRDVAQFEKLVRKSFSEQYLNGDLDAYLQLHRTNRIVLIDNWHLAKISGETRLAIYSWLNTFALSSILFTDKFYEINRIVLKKISIDENLPSEETATSKFELNGLSHVGRGEIIHRWLSLRRDSEAEPPDMSRESKATEDEVSRLLGKDSLPPFAFFIICLLQARENRIIDKIAGGSFGRLYEVLITSALIKGESNGSLLDRKYALLSEMAAFMWRNESTTISHEEVKTVAEDYSRNFLLELQIEELLPAMERAYVIKRSGDHYSFSYLQFFYYFIALYIRDRIDDAEDEKLSESIDYMIDNISSGMNSSIIMFLIYFAKEKRRIIDRLVQNASQIYSEIEPARVEDDAKSFYFRKEAPETPVVTENIDIAANRAEARKSLDAKSNTFNSDSEVLGDETFCYSTELQDARKLHLADRNLDALGQVIRTFSTTLPLKDKIKVLQCAYLLGLRATARTLALLESFINATETLLEAKDRLGIAFPDGATLTELKKQLDQMGLTTGKAVVLIFIKKISSSVGVLDMEQAYRRVMEVLPVSNATKLTDITIQMDHFREFPESGILRLNKELESNPFAHGVLKWLVASYLLLYKVERQVRQRVSNKLGLNEDAILRLSLNQESKQKL